METTTLLIILGVIAIGLIFKSIISKNGSENHPIDRRSAPLIKPTEKVNNDKIIVVKNAIPEEVKQAIQQFCNQYNQEKISALPTLTIVSDTEFVITFPYDADFVTFCYFVNYLHYPHDIEYKPDIKAWMTTKEGETWMKDNIVNKKVMLYIPPDDVEHDNVYLTTFDNVGYLMGFAYGKESKRLKSPVMLYQEPSFDVNNFWGRETITFE